MRSPRRGAKIMSEAGVVVVVGALPREAVLRVAITCQNA
jgi:hypothetical protein